MPSINEVIERTGRARPDALDDETKAGWLIELDGKLYRELVLRHEATMPRPEPPTKYPEDGDKPLLAGTPYGNLYDLYLIAQADFYTREDSQTYNNSALAFNNALDEYRKEYHRTHTPLPTDGFRRLL
ncbi:MAG: hypothetical protein RR415_13210 [Ruthenibacterium sp.]